MGSIRRAGEARWRGVWILPALLLALFLAFPAHAVEPGEMLKDPVLEHRAREISKEIRCLVCRNESIDVSSADLAHDLRVLVRDRLKAGDTNAEVKQYLVDRYGEFVLLEPRFSLANAFIWLAGPLALVIGLGAVFVYMRGRRPDAALAGPQALSQAEEAALERALREQ